MQCSLSLSSWMGLPVRWVILNCVDAFALLCEIISGNSSLREISHPVEWPHDCAPLLSSIVSKAWFLFFHPVCILACDSCVLEQTTTQLQIGSRDDINSAFLRCRACHICRRNLPLVNSDTRCPHYLNRSLCFGYPGHLLCLGSFEDSCQLWWVWCPLDLRHVLDCKTGGLQLPSNARGELGDIAAMAYKEVVSEPVMREAFNVNPCPFGRPRDERHVLILPLFGAINFLGKLMITLAPPLMTTKVEETSCISELRDKSNKTVS